MDAKVTTGPGAPCPPFLELPREGVCSRWSLGPPGLFPLLQPLHLEVPNVGSVCTAGHMVANVFVGVALECPISNTAKSKSFPKLLRMR